MTAPAQQHAASNRPATLTSRDHFDRFPLLIQNPPLLGQPVAQSRFNGGLFGLELCLQVLERLVMCCECLVVCRLLLWFQVCFEVLLVGVIKEGVKAEELSLRNRVILMRVALSTAGSQSHPHSHRRIDAIDGRLHAELFGVDATFSICQRVAVKAGGELHLLCCSREQVTCQLLYGKLVKRQISIDRVDEPIPPAPSMRTRQVLFVTVAVGVPGQIEPLHRPLLAKVGRPQQSINQFHIEIRRLVTDELLDLSRRRRQAGQVERHTSQKCVPIGWPIRLKSSGSESRSHKPIDWILFISVRQFRT